MQVFLACQQFSFHATCLQKDMRYRLQVLSACFLVEEESGEMFGRLELCMHPGNSCRPVF